MISSSGISFPLRKKKSVNILQILNLPGGKRMMKSELLKLFSKAPSIKSFTTPQQPFSTHHYQLSQGGNTLGRTANLWEQFPCTFSWPDSKKHKAKKKKESGDLHRYYSSCDMWQMLSEVEVFITTFYPKQMLTWKITCPAGTVAAAYSSWSLPGRQIHIWMCPCSTHRSTFTL